MVNHKRKIFCLMGPTAVGKTELALKLASKLKLEIISVDSGMVYRGLDIGTAKPTAQQLQMVPHYLVDICDPRETYSAGQFRTDALQKIQEIFAKGSVPLLVGGTMLYFYVLQHGIANLPQADASVRVKLQEEQERLGLASLYLRLQQIDPKTAASISCNDKQRIQRALEIYELTGKSLSEVQALASPNELPYEVVNIIIAPRDRSLLRHEIEKRFIAMLKSGFIDEVRQLYCRGDLYPDLPAMRTVGYRQIWQYLAGTISYEKMQELALTATKQLAKRQLTWLKNKQWRNAKWFTSDDPWLKSNVIKLVQLA